nr:Asp-tRNA(Asn)/Glu-tRNA(Gln) amidotransferase subunit GatC [Fusibacter ferrireducens]
MTHEVIEHVAKLSRIELDEAEKEMLTSDLMKIIAFADQLSEVDTSSVHMKESLSNAENVFRVDQVIAFDDQEGLLKNAAQVTENCIFVPKTVE